MNDERQMYEGTIAKLRLDKGFGFIERPSGTDLFFHVNDLVDDLEFDEALEQLRVRFDVRETPRGPQASNVRAAE